MKILLVQTGFLGDMVLSTPVLSNLRRIYPDASLSVLCTPAAEPLLHCHPSGIRTIIYDKRGRDAGLPGFRRLCRQLKQEHFDAAFSLHKSFRTAFLLALAGIPKRYGFAEASASFLYTARASRGGLRHEVLRNLTILDTIEAGKTRLLDLSLGLSPEAIERAESLLGPALRAIGRERASKLVGIAPGSVWAAKRWTSSGFAAVARALSCAGYVIVLIGGRNDAAAASEIEEAVGFPLINLAGKTDLQVSAAVISRLALLVTNDSAPMHIAAALKTPVAAVFCATVPEFGYGPWMVDHETIGLSNLSCRPCSRHGGQKCPLGTFACRDLPPEPVIAAALRLLSGRGKNRIDEEQRCITAA